MRKSGVITTAALVMILAVSVSQPARADAKSEFKKGCESVHNSSYVENAENVQCNSPSGTTITCDKNITHCTASAQATHITTIQPTAGALKEYMTGKARITVPHGWKIVRTQSKN